jgi:hypothetical protein
MTAKARVRGPLSGPANGGSSPARAEPDHNPQMAASGSGPGRSRRLRAAALDATALVGSAVAVGVVYGWPLVARRLSAPVGYDTPKYLWRTNLVAAKGIASLAGSAPVPFQVNADRPGLPMLWSVLSSWLHVSPVRVGLVFPVAMAVCIGLAAAAVAGAGLKLPRWAGPVFVLATGASINVARMAAAGYDDNLLVTGVVLAAAVLAVLAAEGRPAAAGAVALLVTGLLVHWLFALLVAALLGAVALLLLPRSLRARASGTPLAQTGSGRLAVILGSSGVLGAAALASLAAGQPRSPKLPGESFSLKLSRDVPRYGLPALAPGTALGAAVGVRTSPSRPRTMVALIVLWAATAAVAVGLLLLGAPVPAHRFLAFAMGMPLLFAVAIAGVVGLLRSRAGPVGLVAGVMAALAMLAGSTIVAFRGWDEAKPWMLRTEVVQAATAGTYLERIGGDRPVVFVVNQRGSPLSTTSLAFHVIRSGLPAGVIPRTFVYLGDPERLLRGDPTLDPQIPSFDKASQTHFAAVRPLLAQRPVVLVLQAFHHGYRAIVKAHPEWEIAPGIAVVQGPRPSGIRPAPGLPAPLSGGRMAVLAAAFVLALGAAGGGWAVVLVPASNRDRAALAPAIGIAAIVLPGVVAGRLGFGAGSGLVSGAVLVFAAAGWALAIARVRPGVVSSPERSRPRPGPPSTTSPPAP